jgi:hypothetical protein
VCLHVYLGHGYTCKHTEITYAFKHACTQAIAHIEHRKREMGRARERNRKMERERERERQGRERESISLSFSRSRSLSLSFAPPAPALAPPRYLASITAATNDVASPSPAPSS